jgi:hypothetical protein
VIKEKVVITRILVNFVLMVEKEQGGMIGVVVKKKKDAQIHGHPSKYGIKWQQNKELE